MDLTNLTFIDVETTGLSPSRDRIIEIGLLRMQKGKVKKTYSSLVNPEMSLPPEITMLTGITARELDDAPVFSSIADEIRELLEGTLFVAHNARFDYSFIKTEFARVDTSFNARILCTAKLSRRLFPRFRRHNLDSIIERFGIHVETRHRAFDDAKVLAEFYIRAKKQFGTKILSDAAAYVTKTASIPKSLDAAMVARLPESPGVYIFYGKGGNPLYIGKSINIRDRVRSHFYDYSQSNKEARIFQTIESMETIQTSGELGALLLESQMIKKFQPLYNRQLRRMNSLIALFRYETDDGYFTVSEHELSEIKIEDIENIIGVYRTRRQMKESLTELAREYTLCKKLLGIEKTKGACFGRQLHSCNGACLSEERPMKYNIRFIEAFSKTKIKQWPFAGAIAIREGSHAHIVDKWCYMGEAGNLLSEPQFDYDSYKILSSHLLRKVSNRQIRVLPPNYMSL